MYGVAEKIYYALLAVILGATLFVFQQAPNPDVASFQSGVVRQFATASVQVFGDQPVFDDNFLLVINSINDFYNQSATELLALLQPVPTEDGMMYVFGNVYHDLAFLVQPENLSLALVKPQVLGVQIGSDKPSDLSDNLIQKNPIYNIVPQVMSELDLPPQSPQKTRVPISEEIIATEIDAQVITANDHGNPWVNLRDVSTGQVYCVAIFNAEVNRYLGSCKNDYR